MCICDCGIVVFIWCDKAGLGKVVSLPPSKTDRKFKATFLISDITP